MLEDMLTAHINSDMDLQSMRDFEGELTMELGSDSDYDGSDMDISDLGSVIIPTRV